MRKLYVFMVLLWWCLPSLAQEATPEAVPIVNGIALNQLTELNGLTVRHPTGWYAINADQGSVIVSNLDLLSIRPDTTIPVGTLIVRLNLYNYSQLSAETAATASTAPQILAAIPLPIAATVAAGTPTPTPPTITEIVVGETVIARADASSDGTEAAVYLVKITPKTFMVAVTASNESGVLAQLEPTVAAILVSLALDVSAPIPATIANYPDIERRVSSEGFPIVGSAAAPVKVTIITSFDCLPCRTLYEFGLPILLQRVRTGEVELTLVPIAGTGTIFGGDRAAVAALCAQEQNLFWQMHDALFYWQDFGNHAFIDDRLASGITQLGGDLTTFEACLRSERPLATLNNAITTIQRLGTGFRGTPSLLMNNVFVAWNPSNLNALVDAQLNPPTPTIEATAEATPEATTAP